jgi:hypothetical protein
LVDALLQRHADLVVVQSLGAELIVAALKHDQDEHAKSSIATDI